MPTLSNPESEFLNFGVPLNDFDFVTGVGGANPDPFVAEPNAGEQFGDYSPAEGSKNTGFFGGLAEVVGGITRTVNDALPAYVDYELTKSQIDALKAQAQRGQVVGDVPKQTQPVTSNVGIKPDAVQIGKTELIIGGVLIALIIGVVIARKR
jgi:hypothetical protein